MAPLDEGLKEFSKHTLIVDSSPFSRGLLKAYLGSYFDKVRGKPARIDFSASTLDALKLLKSEEYSLIITDIGGGETRGLDLLENLRFEKFNLPKYRVVMTEKPTMYNLQRSLELGCYDRIWKGSKGNVKGKIVASVGELVYRVNREFCAPKKPNLYIFCGTKGVGKSETANHVCRFVPNFELIPKHSQRKKSKRDELIVDTLPFPARDKCGKRIALEYAIRWTNYGKHYAIDTKRIDAAFRRGNDAAVCIGSIDGVRSALELYPRAEVFNISLDKTIIKSILESRGDPFEWRKVLSVREKFNFSEFTKITNRDFYNVPKYVENLVYSMRNK